MDVKKNNTQDNKSDTIDKSWQPTSNSSADLENLLETTAKEKIQKEQLISEWWKTIFQVSTELNVSFWTVHIILKWINKSDPSWKIKFSNDDLLLSPKIIESIMAEIHYVKSSAPEWWKTIKEIAKTCWVSEYYIMNIIDKEIKADSNTFRYYKNQSNNWLPSLHLAPELIDLVIKKIQTSKSNIPTISEIVKQTIAEIKPNTVKQIWYAPEWWITQYKISKNLQCGTMTIHKIILKLLKELDLSKYNKSELFWEYKSKTWGKSFQFFSPLFVSMVEQKLWMLNLKKEDIKTKPTQSNFPPEWWMTYTEIENAYWKSRYVIDKIINKYLSDNTNLSRQFTNQKWKTCMYLAPELVEIIFNTSSSLINKAPEWWQTLWQIINSLWRKIYRIIINLRNEHRNLNPKLIQEFTNESWVIQLYYSPEFVEILRKKLGK